MPSKTYCYVTFKSEEDRSVSCSGFLEVWIVPSVFCASLDVGCSEGFERVCMEEENHYCQGRIQLMLFTSISRQI